MIFCFRLIAEKAVTRIAIFSCFDDNRQMNEHLLGFRETLVILDRLT